MQLPLFKALKSVQVSDDQATAVVDALEEYMAVKIKEATAGLEAQNIALQAQLKAQTWVIGSVGLLMAVIGLAPAIAKLFH